MPPRINDTKLSRIRRRDQPRSADRDVVPGPDPARPGDRLSRRTRRSCSNEQAVPVHHVHEIARPTAGCTDRARAGRRGARRPVRTRSGYGACAHRHGAKQQLAPYRGAAAIGEGKPDVPDPDQPLAPAPAALDAALRQRSTSGPAMPSSRLAVTKNSSGAAVTAASHRSVPRHQRRFGVSRLAGLTARA
jgi:hypothetical protein